MAKKSKEPTWDQIGKMVGKKIEKESKKGECAPWNKWKKKKVVNSCSCGGVYFLGFIGAEIKRIVSNHRKAKRPNPGLGSVNSSKMKNLIRF